VTDIGTNPQVSRQAMHSQMWHGCIQWLLR